MLGELHPNPTHYSLLNPYYSITTSKRACDHWWGWYSGSRNQNYAALILYFYFLYWIEKCQKKGRNEGKFKLC